MWFGWPAALVWDFGLVQLFGAEGVGDDWGRGEGGLILGVEFREAGGKVSIGFMVLGNGMGVAEGLGRGVANDDDGLVVGFGFTCPTSLRRLLVESWCRGEDTRCVTAEKLVVDRRDVICP